MPGRRPAGWRLLRRVQSELLPLSPSLGDSPLIVAVSGGPDSLALLLALGELSGPLGLKLHVAHLDHGLRGEEARQDALFVEEVAQRLGVGCTVGRADVASLRRRKHLSYEEAAREARYAFLAGVAEEIGARAVALGHTADDQAETVLMNLMRGSGLHGLRGMRRVTPWRDRQSGRDLSLLRPMLEVHRWETEAYCQSRGFAPRRDSSNQSPQFTRNLVRQQLLPVMERLNPRVKQSLLRVAHWAARDVDYLERRVSLEWPRVVRGEGGLLKLEVAALKALDPALAAYLLRRAYQEVRGEIKGPEQVHLEAMLELLTSSSAWLDLPGGVQARLSYGMLTLGNRGDMPPDPRALKGEHPLCASGETELEEWRVLASVDEPREIEREASPYSAVMDLEALGGALLVRSRHPGDRFQPLGMQQAKRLQDFLTDAKVPEEERDAVPLVVSPRGIAWVVGWRIAHWARVIPATRSCLRLEFQRRQEQA